jgi:hypothetical protein
MTSDASDLSEQEARWVLRRAARHDAECALTAGHLSVAAIVRLGVDSGLSEEAIRVAIDEARLRPCLRYRLAQGAMWGTCSLFGLDLLAMIALIPFESSLPDAVWALIWMLFPLSGVASAISTAWYGSEERARTGRGGRATTPVPGRG